MLTAFPPGCHAKRGRTVAPEPFRGIAVSSRRLCIFNLTDNFHPFFLATARTLEREGIDVRFLNFWPGELVSLRKNGAGDKILDWKSGFLDRQEPVRDAELDRWIGYDPRYLAMPAAAKPAERERFRLAAQYLRPAFRHVLKHNAIDAVFFWNGYRFPEPLLLDVCRELNLPVLFGENGFFGHTMQIDPEGINAACSLRRRPAEAWRGCDPAREPRFAKFLETGGNLPPEGTPLPPIAKVDRAERLESLMKPFVTERALYSKLVRKSPFQGMADNRRIERLKRERPSSKATPLPRKYLFLPLQVHDDTQIVIHSPWVASMEAMVEEVKKAHAALGLDHGLVVKEHPVDLGRYDYTEYARRSGTTWLWDYPLDTVMNGADVVITVNSSVGIEAVVRGKPVVTLGNALYNIPGVVHHAPNAAALPGAIRAALDTPPDTAFRHEVLCRLRFADMVDASWGRPTDRGVTAAAARIRSLLGW